MRPVQISLLVIAIAVSFGCNETRSVSKEEAKEIEASQINTKKNSDKNARSAGTPTPIISPVFPADIDEVQDAVVRACNSYSHHVDDDDRKNHRVQLIDINFFAGNTETLFILTKTENGDIRVDAESQSHGNPSLGGGRERHVITEIFSRIDGEMKVRPRKLNAEARLKELDDLHGKKLVTDDEYQKKRNEIISGL